jgi:hypothetical protein
MVSLALHCRSIRPRDGNKMVSNPPAGLEPGKLFAHKSLLRSHALGLGGAQRGARRKSVSGARQRAQLTPGRSPVSCQPIPGHARI